MGIHEERLVLVMEMLPVECEAERDPNGNPLAWSRSTNNGRTQMTTPPWFGDRIGYRQSEASASHDDCFLAVAEPTRITVPFLRTSLLGPSRQAQSMIPVGVVCSLFCGAKREASQYGKSPCQLPVSRQHDVDADNGADHSGSSGNGDTEKPKGPVRQLNVRENMALTQIECLTISQSITGRKAEVACSDGNRMLREKTDERCEKKSGRLKKERQAQTSCSQ
ncbi:uncharacterized protein B0T23DRAFT_418342 [Neurospora hispaniola]|uniref:Uncharacterized protein n=1 Tax=Neurospora hispaniola TaxID=588809 RepID=A0AAJ0ICR5_9PEZI|nr:hypothetical protein B0T23DRAFT_418342 [Neurospora hispaniola]